MGDALGEWEAAHASLVNDPASWPKRVLQSKVAESGLAQMLGFKDGTALEAASKQHLLSAYKRIPSVKRMAALMEGGRGWATLPPPEALPRSTYSKC